MELVSRPALEITTAKEISVHGRDLSATLFRKEELMKNDSNNIYFLSHGLS
jgi:hypothetical protein